MGISEQTLSNWRRKYGGMGVGELRRLKELEEENRKLKAMVADLRGRSGAKCTRSAILRFLRAHPWQNLR